MTANDRTIDILILGSTGVTGKLLVSLWARQLGFSSQYKIALAGRSKSRLQEIVERLMDESKQKGANRSIRKAAELAQRQHDELQYEVVPTFEIKNQEDLKSVIKKSKIVINLTGPYSTCGEAVVQACSETGTDYIDVTGELSWLKDMSDKYSHIAESTNARIVSCCGVFALLFELGVGTLQREALHDNNMPIQKVEQVYIYDVVKPSAGTLKSLFLEYRKINLFNLKGRLLDPYYLCNDEHSASMRSNNSPIMISRYSNLFNGWLSPSVLNSPLSQYIHWTNSIKRFQYGRNFIYHGAKYSPSLFRSLIDTCTFIGSTIVLMISSRIPGFEYILPKLKDQNLWEKHTVNKYPITIRTIGQLRNSKTDSNIIYEHNIKFSGGDGYVMTAYTALYAALNCLKHRNSKTISGGFKCPTEVLSPDFEAQLESTNSFDIKKTVTSRQLL